MSELDLLPTADEDALRSTVAALLQSRCDAAAVSALYDGDASSVGSIWTGLAREVGVAGLLVPEDLGGAGAGAREAAVVMEELGRAVAPAPYLTSSVIATAALLAGDATEPGQALLGALATGERCAALAVPFTAGDAAGHGLAEAEGRISGTVRSVAGALEADVLLVPVATGAGLEIRAVDRDAVRVEPVVSLDMSRQLADLVIDDATGAVVVPADTGAAAVDHALRTGAGLLASEQVGLAAWCLGTTVAYLKERRQFGRAVGGFQALKHRLADLYVTVESATSVARYAAAALAVADPDARIGVHLAAAYCGDAAVLAAEEALQLHGGIGMTWEHPVHLYLKRAKADQLALGSPGWHRERLADLVDLPGPV